MSEAVDYCAFGRAGNAMSGIVLIRPRSSQDSQTHLRLDRDATPDESNVLGDHRSAQTALSPSSAGPFGSKCLRFVPVFHRVEWTPLGQVRSAIDSLPVRSS